VLFNQASTGFVSGISFGYEGLLFKGAHLGQAFKWQAIKNSISYEQQRDRESISAENGRTRNAKLTRAGETDIAGTSISAAVAAGRNLQATTGNANDASQNAGSLQERHAAHRKDQPGSADNRRADAGDKTVVKRNSGEGQTSQGTEQHREPLGHPALPHLDLIERLIGPDDTADSLDQKALSEFENKKRKGQKISS
jgi:hypothetical protein